MRFGPIKPAILYFSLSIFLVVAFVCSLTNMATAVDDWPNWRGPNHNDISLESDLLESWPESGPKQIWINKQAGLGYAGIAIVGDDLFTMGLEDDQEFALCLDAEKGTEKWRVNIGNRFKNKWGDGPRSTPSVDGERVYFLSAKGHLACLKTRDGEKVWEKKLTDFGGEIPYWGYAESPLVHGGQVVCTPSGPKSGAMIAFDKLTGAKIWDSEFKLGEQQNKSYSSIVPTELGGKTQYVQLTTSHLIGVDAEDGSLLWKSEWPGRIAVIPSPVIDKNRVYATSGYGIGSKMVEVENNEASELWFNKVMKNHHGGVILVGDYIYGYSDKAGWICQNKSDGEMVWNNKKIKKGAVTYADGLFYHVQENDGQVILIKADGDGLKEKGRFKLKPQTKRRSPDGMIWMHPVISDGKLYLRDQEIIYCYDIREK